MSQELAGYSGVPIYKIRTRRASTAMLPSTIKRGHLLPSTIVRDHDLDLSSVGRTGRHKRQIIEVSRHAWINRALADDDEEEEEEGEEDEQQELCIGSDTDTRSCALGEE